MVCSDRFEPSPCPTGDLRLEIGDRSWSLADGPGSAMVSATTAVSVRVVEAESCLVLVEFEA